MQHSEAAASLVKQFEGCELTAYPDPATGAEPWTIGYGHTGADVHPGLTWTQAQADAALNADLARFDEGVTALIGAVPTTQNQFDALVDFAYNLGLANLGRSTLLTRHRVGDYAGAAVEFAKWNRAGGRILNGLTRRRAAEAALYRGQA